MSATIRVIEAAATGKLISITVELFVRPVRPDRVLYRGR